MSLLNEVLESHGGLDLWRRRHRFIAHMSLKGTLIGQRRGGRQLADIAVEGSIHGQWLAITGFGPDLRSYYRPDWVGIENSDGNLVARSTKPIVPVSRQRRSWGECDLAYFCGYAIWNYLASPFLLTLPGVHIKELAVWRENGEKWRRLWASFPCSIVTHDWVQVFYFDDSGWLRRLDYRSTAFGPTPVIQYTWAHQLFSGIVVPTLSRYVRVREDGTAERSPALSLEVFDAEFA